MKLQSPLPLPPKSTFLLLLPLLLLLLLFTPSPPSQSNYHSLFLSLSLSLSSNDTVARHLQTLTLRPHVAGTASNSIVSSYILRILSSSSSISARISPYETLLSYPILRSLSLSLSPNSSSPSTTFSLNPKPYPGEPFAAEVLPTFHAYARSASASGPLVYANYGRPEDFAQLRASGVDIAGSVVIAREMKPS